MLLPGVGIEVLGFPGVVAMGSYDMFCIGGEVCASVNESGGSGA